MNLCQGDGDHTIQLAMAGTQDWWLHCWVANSIWLELAELLITNHGSLYQFTKVLHMTPSELDEVWYASSPGDHMCPKEISPQLLVWLLGNSLLNIPVYVISFLKINLMMLVISYVS